MWTCKKVLKRINENIIEPFELKGLNKDFRKRLNHEFCHLWDLYSTLYGNRFDFLYQLEDLVTLMAEKSMERPKSFAPLDKKRIRGENWFSGTKSVGVMLYIDLFNKNLKGFKDKLDYFSDLGVNTIHLMPLFKAPVGESDGGYAVSDYQKIRKELGSMKELAELAEIMRSRGMVLILDFILNHTSDEHIWARCALEGDREFQNYYFMCNTREEADSYDSTLREIFPSIRKGSFTYAPACDKWVWTTFNSFQWDLNYSNPDLFRAMCEQMLFLANHGAEVLRLDALAFTWKEKGTICENLPKAHTLIKTFRAIAAITTPALSFLSEAIVHPDEVVTYVSGKECELSYNPLLMATTWEALATRNTDLLKKSFSPRFFIPENCSWVNYIRCHDDIGWTFCDEDAASLNINGFDHRKFLNSFYTGRFEGSFASGVPFQENLETGDVRISGTLASLAGVERALNSDDPELLDMAVKRVKMLLGFILSMPGLPLIYSGDEQALLNDYSYLESEDHCEDSRWVHRGFFPWNKVEGNKDSSISHEVYDFIKMMIKLRTATAVLEGSRELLNLGSSNLLGLKMTHKNEHLLIIINFTERISDLSFNSLRLYGGDCKFRNLINGEMITFDYNVGAYEILWLKGVAK